MEIKPPGSGKPVFEPSKNSGSVDEKPGKFQEKLEVAGNIRMPSSSSPAVGVLRSRFSKSDLDDSSKLESIYNYVVREVILGELPQAMQLSGADRQSVASWMANDPIIQGKLMSFLRKTLD